MSLATNSFEEAALLPQQLFNNVIMKDWTTRLYVPNSLTDIHKLSLLAAFQSYVTGALAGAAFIGGSSFYQGMDAFTTIIKDIANAPFLELGVTQIGVANEHVMPTTKGIGSRGEMIHLLGAKNETLTLSFTTDKYPSLLGMFLRRMLLDILANANIVYIIDDLTGSLPLLMKKFRIAKSANMIGALQGSMEFFVLKKKGNSLYEEARDTALLMKSVSKSAFYNIPSILPIGNWLYGLGAAMTAGILAKSFGGGILNESYESTNYPEGS